MGEVLIGLGILAALWLGVPALMGAWESWQRHRFGIGGPVRQRPWPPPPPRDHPRQCTARTRPGDDGPKPKRPPTVPAKRECPHCGGNLNG